MRPFLTLLVAALFLVTIAVHAEQPATDKERAVVLVEQLGSDDFQEREAAARELDRLGPASLAALQAVAKHPDLELRCRAAEVRRGIERRVETARMLETPRLRLQYKNAPLADVLADLSKRSGNPLKLGTGVKTEELGKRTVTLDGEWTFWEALERVCDAAGVTDPEPDAVTPPAQAPLEESFRGRGRRVMYLDSSHLGKPAERIEPLLLTDGKRNVRPTFQNGALRIRVLAPRAVDPGTTFAPSIREATLTLEVKPEPRISWEKVSVVRIDRVIDNRGRALKRPAAVVPESKLIDISEDIILIWDGQTDLPLAPAPQLFTMQFPLHELTGKSLREINGTVGGWIRTTPETIFSIDNLAKDLNETHHGPDECRLKVTECKRDDGLYKLEIELSPPRSPNALYSLPNRILRMNRRVVEKIHIDVDAQTSPFVVANEKGEPLGLVNGEYEIDTNGRSRVYTLTYKPDANDHGPVKLIYRDRRSAFVEVSFTLKDVPLFK